MKAIGAIVFGIASSVGICMAGVTFASYISSESQVSRFDNPDQPPLWTAAPKVIDTKSQDLARLPARLSTYAVAELEREKTDPNAPQVASARPSRNASASSMVDVASTTGSIDDDYARQNVSGADLRGNVQTVQLSSAHISWCEANYRSYDASTDSYRSFSGDIRPCESPVEDSPSVTHVSTSTPDRAAYTQAHLDWCGNRYRSYRASDNSYQPYDGSRTQCVSPYSDGAMNMASN
ncbi:BA14K family protein [Rhizobium halophytocola]|uniref:Lectin-like protein BA14k n=1 Tax=Rhizobium halophytocola TaxID=735519 RepID=A0ABS4DWR6_9HYPH|nr:BA14K family protein [Rhizobium halophytocola]MBP1850138.1 hypothetical protein [Rhizobium halophytocola]